MALSITTTRGLSAHCCEQITTPWETQGITEEDLELAQELGIETKEADIDLYDAYTADEAFVTSTSFCICPVSSINGANIGDSVMVPGPLTSRLLDAYSGLVGIDIAGQYLSRL